MILFETRYNEIFNLIIYHLLKSESKKGIDNIIEEIAPKYLRREQFSNCVATFSKFLEWTNDDFYHHLTPFSKALLYQFLNRNCIQNTLIHLKNNKSFQSKLKIVMNNFVLNKEDINKNLYNIKWYINNLFVNQSIIDIISFENIEELKAYLKKKAINISAYSEILPFEIQKSLKKDIYLYQTVKKLINFIQEKINFGNLGNLFWLDNFPKSESEIQEVLVCLFNAYIHGADVDINREALVGSGKIDFKFYRYDDDKVLIEIKKANSKNLQFGYEKQLLEYMNACKCNYGYYIILCFDDKDINRAKKLIENGKNIYNYNVDIIIFDLRKKEKIFSKHYESIFNHNLPDEIDNYFDHIFDILNLDTSIEIVNYLKALLNNFNKIEDENIKLDFISKVHEVSTYYRQSDFSFMNFFDEDQFYFIFEQNAMQRFVLNTLCNINNESSFYKIVPEIMDLLKNYTSKENGIHITKQEILEIFAYLKSEKNAFYKVLQSKVLKIYMLNETALDSNSSVIPTLNTNKFSLLCSNIRKSDEKVSPIYVFFYLLGQILNWSITKSHKVVPKSFLTAMLPFTEDLEYDNPNASIFFADSVAMYLIHNSKYQKYDLFYREIDEIIYQKLQMYFDKLLMEIEVKNDKLYK